jgi:hypothetical protein
VRDRFGLDGQLFDSEADAQEHDPFPGALDLPIIHIDRVDDTSISTEELLEAERRVEEFVVQSFGGRFAGT